MKDKNDNEKFKKEFKKRLYTLVLRTIGLLDKLPKDNISQRMADQLVRSITSILANYVEGLSASSKKDFTNFFNHSLKSANESRVWFVLLRDSGRVPQNEASWFLKELKEVANIFGSSILTLRGKR